MIVKFDEVGIFTRKISADRDRVAVRVICGETGHTDGRPVPPHIIADAAIYQEAFDRLSQALSVEARES